MKAFFRSSSISFLATTLAFSIAPLGAQIAPPEPVERLSPLVVTTTAVGARPLATVLDTKAAAQPIPAQDGADILKSTKRGQSRCSFNPRNSSNTPCSGTIRGSGGVFFKTSHHGSCTRTKGREPIS